MELLPKYDTIIITPSNDEQNMEFIRALIRLIPHEKTIEHFFDKWSANDVYEYLIDDEYINKSCPNSIRVFNEIDEAFAKMNIENNGVFSYKSPCRQDLLEKVVLFFYHKDILIIPVLGIVRLLFVSL